MNSADIADAFVSTKDTLYEAGIEDDFLLDLVASRLLIERVGESKNLDWWESRTLSETGRARLSEVTPKTQLKSQISLALEVGRKVESDRLPDDSISLFNFGPQVEARLAAALEDTETDESRTLGALENLSLQSVDEGWTDQLIEETASNISGAADAAFGTEDLTGGSFLVEEAGFTEDEIGPEKWRILTTLLRGYGLCTDQLTVPYYPLKSELKSESA